MAKVDFGYEALYLLKYLKETGNPLVNDADFINERADLARQEYEKNRLSGLDVLQAQERAMRPLQKKSGI